MKIACNFDKNMKALYSNVNSNDKNAFYLLMTYHKNKKGGFGTEISVEQCNKMLKRKNKQFYYIDYPKEV